MLAKNSWKKKFIPPCGVPPRTKRGATPNEWPQAHHQQSPQTRPAEGPGTHPKTHRSPGTQLAEELGIQDRVIPDLIAFEQIKIKLKSKIAKLVFFEKRIRPRLKLFVIHGQFD